MKYKKSNRKCPCPHRNKEGQCNWVARIELNNCDHKGSRMLCKFYLLSLDQTTMDKWIKNDPEMIAVVELEQIRDAILKFITESDEGKVSFKAILDKFSIPEIKLKQIVTSMNEDLIIYKCDPGFYSYY